MSSTDDSAPVNWTAVAALYAGLSLGIVALLYGGHYRNATWLALLGLGGACTAVARVLESRGTEAVARYWNWAAGLVYAVFFVWAGVVLLRALTGT